MFLSHHHYRRKSGRGVQGSRNPRCAWPLNVKPKQRKFEGTDLEPIPFSSRHCKLAKRLKEKGLDWEPHVGCFVWDENGHISVSSPFPNRIYFIPNLDHFFKSLSSINSCLALNNS